MICATTGQPCGLIMVCWNQSWKVERVLLKKGDNVRLRFWTLEYLNIWTVQ